VTFVAKDRRSRDQKRKAKLSERNRRGSTSDITPYEGSKYKGSEWIPHMLATETGVYETILKSQHKLTNSQVKAAFEQLIRELRGGAPALPEVDTPQLSFEPGKEVEYLVWNIREHWARLFASVGRVGAADLIGILRTLLASMEVHALRTGSSRGYVAFLPGFIEKTL
jgi:hypothetical protein